MQMDTRVRTMTNAEYFAFLDLPENADQRFELLDGEVYVMPSPSYLHGLIVMRITYFVMAYLMAHDIGYVVGDNNDFELSEGYVLKPDASVVLKARMPTIPKRAQLAPDIAVEVVSPSNSAPDLMRKVEAYIQHGTQIVWVVYSDERAVRVYTPNPDGSLTVRRLGAADLLDGGAALPGFSVRVGELFPPVDAVSVEGSPA